MNKLALFCKLAHCAHYDIKVDGLLLKHNQILREFFKKNDSLGVKEYLSEERKAVWPNSIEAVEI